MPSVFTDGAGAAYKRHKLHDGITDMPRPIHTALAALALAFAPLTAIAEPSHGIAMHGDPALPADFTHLPYANPDAPKGGKLRYGVSGTFDSLNPFVLKSMRTSARGLWDPIFDNLVYESLLKRSRDEPFTLYGLLAEKVEMADDRSWVEFHLNPQAKFSDGKPLEVSDVLFTFNLMKEKGRPPFSSRMSRVERMEQTGERSVKITFNERASREAPLLFGLMPILPEHATDAENFQQSTLKPPISTGPYKVAEVRPGERIVYQKDPDYWGRDLPINRGFFNFDEIRVDYFRSGNAQFEAFKKGLFDVYPENSPAKWRTDYDFPAVERGEIVMEVFEPELPSGMMGLVFNTRRPVFENRNVRKALAMLFDFEWVNDNLFFGAYERTTSFWQGSSLSSLDRPADASERALLAKYPDAVDPEVLEGTYRAPKTDGSGRNRKVLREALELFKGEGYTLQGGRLVDANARPLRFEMLIAGDAGISGQETERLALAYKRSAAQIGVEVVVRPVDDSQYQARKTNFDYDMIITRFTSSLSPGAEQENRWGSESRDRSGSFNFAGAAEPVLDEAIAALLAAKERDEFENAVRAFDRALISGHYLVPLYHSTKQRVAYRSHLAHPDQLPLYGPWYATWWSRNAK